MPGKALILDANILVRAVLGIRVRELSEAHCGDILFLIPDTAYREAEENLPALIVRRKGDPDKALLLLRTLKNLAQQVGPEVYGNFEAVARERLGERDPEDWPILATALALRCPIWTEDTYFFGCGVATWTTSRIAIFLRD